MAIFGNARQRFLDRFEPRGDGFAYRWSPHARAVLVTAKERHWLVQDYDDRRDLVHILMLATPVAMILAGILAYAISSAPSVVAATVWCTLIGFPSLVALWGEAGRWRLLRRRPYVDKGLPKAEAERRRLRDLSWASLVLPALSTTLWCWTIVGSKDTHPIWRVLAGFAGVLVLGIAVREGYLKVKQRRQPWPSDAAR